jgi:hypothetical protein
MEPGNMKLLYAFALLTTLSAGRSEAIAHADTKEYVYNEGLRAHNVWEISVSEGCLEAAREMYHGGDLKPAFSSMKDSTEMEVSFARSPDGRRYFAVRAGGLYANGKKVRDTSSLRAELNNDVSWSSDLVWISADDEQTFDVFKALWDKCLIDQELPNILGEEQGRRLHLYSAFFMVRSRSTRPNFHLDFADEVGHRALTFVTPIDRFTVDESNERGRFQMLYANTTASGPATYAWYTRGRPHAAGVMTYNYTYGKGLAFGSGFWHATEPGSSLPNTDPHVFLNFEFGTNQQKHWPAIAEVLDGYQTKWITQPDGTFGLTRLGRRILEDEQRRRDVWLIALGASSVFAAVVVFVFPVSQSVIKQIGAAPVFFVFPVIGRRLRLFLLYFIRRSLRTGRHA